MIHSTAERALEHGNSFRKLVWIRSSAALSASFVVVQRGKTSVTEDRPPIVAVNDERFGTWMKQIEGCEKLTTCAKWQWR